MTGDDSVDEYHVRVELKKAIAEAGGVERFASKHKLRPRDLDLSVNGFLSIIPARVIESIGFVHHVRYRRKEPFKGNGESPSQGR
jgi:hypothetical protein